MPRHDPQGCTEEYKKHTRVQLRLQNLQQFGSQQRLQVPGNGFSQAPGQSQALPFVAAEGMPGQQALWPDEPQTSPPGMETC